MKIKKIILCLLVIMIIFNNCIVAFGVDETTGIKFNDVKENDWFYTVVNECTKLGIINGFPDGSFKPSGKLKEDQVMI